LTPVFPVTVQVTDRGRDILPTRHVTLSQLVARKQQHSELMPRFDACLIFNGTEKQFPALAHAFTRKYRNARVHGPMGENHQ